MKTVYEFPKSTEHKKVLPKNKIYEKAQPTTKVKQLFIDQVEKIEWSYVLAPESINLAKGKSIDEIQVFTIFLKSGTFSDEVLATIDKAIPSPILFMIKFNGKSQLVSCFKTLSTDKKKIIIGSYFKSDWIADNSERVKLPVALNMDGLYHQMLTSLSPMKKRKNETIEDWAQRYENLQSKLQEADRLEQKVNKEKQFNRRVELNHKLNTLKSEIKELEE